MERPSNRLKDQFLGALPYGLILAAYLAGLFVDLLEIDATQYATMSRSMFRSGDYLQLWDKGKAYLDKPPLVFWMSVLSYKVFGVSGWAYKLPSVLFSLWAIYGTNRLGRLLYNAQVGNLSGLVLASSQAFFIMNNDVKTDMYLIAPLVVGIWQLLRWSREGKAWAWIWGSACLGLAMLGKGPLAIIAAGMALGADLLLRRAWRSLFRPQWLLVIPIALAVTIPFLLGLHQQHGWKGVEFFLWTQSFGRVTGESEWSNDATAFFFVHTMAWSFLPWTGMFVIALGKRIWGLVKGRLRLPPDGEAISLAGFMLVFAALSLSNFKLPHYIFVTYPFAAIMVGAWWAEQLDDESATNWRKGFLWLHGVMALLAVGLSLVLGFWAFGGSPILPKVVFILLVVALGTWFFTARNYRLRLLISSVMAFALCNLHLNGVVYPALMPYQSTAMAGKAVAQLGDDQQVYAFIVSGRALDFYAPKEALPVPQLEDLLHMAERGPFLMYTDSVGLREVKNNSLPFQQLGQWEQHSPSKLSIPFLNPSTRHLHVSPRYLLRVGERPQPQHPTSPS